MLKIKYSIRNILRRLGPGFITGAADDDPSGIATYTIAGAQFGYSLNWLSLFLIPMMISIQEMCGRIGMCSGLGLAGAIKKYFPKPILYFSVSLLFVANIINISADMSMMAASLRMSLGLPAYMWLLFITLITIITEIFIPYRKYVQILRFLSLLLFCYTLTVFLVPQNWSEIILKTLIPSFQFSLPFVLTLVGFIGTTISPYLFFWQTAEEIEENINQHKISDFSQHARVSRHDIQKMQKDTAVGMIFSNFISMCIVLTAAATLHRNGLTHISSPEVAAQALTPLAGKFASLLFTVGIVSIGFQAIPILAGGVAYALSETFGFAEGLNKQAKKAKVFYFVIALSTAIGALLNIVGINPIQALFFAAVINGIVAIPLIWVVIKLASDKRVVSIHTSSKLSNITGYITLFVVTAATIILGISYIWAK